MTNKKVIYQVGDLSNGVWFESIDEEKANGVYQESLRDGFFEEKQCEDERRDGGYAPRNDEEIMDDVKKFFFIQEKALEENSDDSI